MERGRRRGQIARMLPAAPPLPGWDTFRVGDVGCLVLGILFQRGFLRVASNRSIARMRTGLERWNGEVFREKRGERAPKLVSQAQACAVASIAVMVRLDGHISERA